ncbi:hypothetical protein WDR79_004948 [Citrobacter freundii]
MTALNKQALTDEVISQAFTGTNFGRDDLKNILSETVIDAAAGWRCGYTATTICTQLGLLTATGRASALGLRFVSEHVQRETKRLKDELEAAEKRIAELRDWNFGLAQESFTYQQRVAELESRTVTVKLPADYRNSDGSINDDMFNTCAVVGAFSEALAAAGIGVKGE